MLQDAGVLSDAGAEELASITERREHLDRGVQHRDFFGSYISGARQIVGDPEQIVEAPVDERLRVAHELVQSPALHLQQGWSVFCRSDPQSAFNSLSDGELTPENGVLWNELLGGLAFGEEQSKAVREDLAVLALERLSGVDADTLRPMLTGLCDVLFVGPRERVDNTDEWLVRLWNAISTQPDDSTDVTLDAVNDLYEYSINSPVGRLSQTLLLEMDARRNEGNGAIDVQLELLRRICVHEGPAGQLARAVFAFDVAFLLSVDTRIVEETLLPRIDSANAEGAELRAVMLKYGSNYARRDCGFRGRDPHGCA